MLVVLKTRNRKKRAACSPYTFVLAEFSGIAKWAFTTGLAVISSAAILGTFPRRRTYYQLLSTRMNAVFDLMHFCSGVSAP